MTTDKPNRWLGYCRVSTEAQAQYGTSLEDQRRRIEAVASYHGVKMDEMYVEQAVSGSIALGQRPEGFKLMAGARRGDTVVVSKLDRAFRSTLDALAVIEVFRIRGVALILADLSVEPLTQDGVGRLFFSIMASLAEFERERIRERTMAGKKRRALEGGYLGGPIPMEMRLMEMPNGKTNVTVDEANVPVLDMAIRLRSNGVSLRDIEVLVREQFPDHPFAQKMSFVHWHRYFSRREIAKPAPPKERSLKGRTRDKERAKKYARPLMEGAGRERYF